MSRPIPFVKGHGTGNDFVLLPNAAGDLVVSAAQVRAVCDRRRGLGADGVLVVARTAQHPVVADQAEMAPWFMDYRNADGSVAEMCGNGARVFAAYLLAEGLVVGSAFTIATRGGPRSVSVVGDSICVDMGEPRFPDVPGLAVHPAELAPTAGPAAAVAVLMPNPHAVTWVEDLAEAGALLAPPAVTPAAAFPSGANVEFVRVLGEHHVGMRVFERGVGETLSCGTGACAAAVATLRRAGLGPKGQQVRVDVPGGTVHVVWRSEGSVELHGPAVLLARGTFDPDWWQVHA